jgi:hypothetical protein
MKSKELGDGVFSIFGRPSSRSSIGRAKMRMYRGENPAAAVPKPEIHPKDVRFLEPEVIPAVLGAVPQQHRLFLRYRRLLRAAQRRSMRAQMGRLRFQAPADLDSTQL